MDSVSIGLDIGSSAVRAAEVEMNGDSRIVRRYGQVGIPAGWVVDGEVVNPLGVAEAIRRLWLETRFSTNKVVVGVSGPRVFVRQADVAGVAVEDLRSALKFNGQELVPIPLDDAAFDFSVLGPSADVEHPGHRVLLVAAHKDILRSYLDVVQSAGLSPVAMDSTSLALLRAVPPVDGDQGLEVIVSIGAELTTVAVRDAGVPRFIRTLTVGGNKLTSSLADSLHLELAAAERLKRGAVPADTPMLGQARRGISADVRDLAEDIRATVDFFTSQADDRKVDRLLITGGGSQMAGLAAAIGGNLPVEVFQVAPFAGLSLGDSGLSQADVARVESSATTAVGLALWPFDSPIIRLSILPEEVAQARRNRRMVQLAATGLAGLVALLGVAGGYRVLQVRHAQAQVHASARQITTLTGNLTALEVKTAVHGQMEGLGATDVAALTGDIDWTRVLGQLAAVMPPNTHITTFTGSRAAAHTTTSESGTVTVAVVGTGNANTAADWLDDLLKTSDFDNTLITGIAMSGTSASPVTFGSTSLLTTSAQSSRAQEAKP